MPCTLLEYSKLADTRIRQELSTANGTLEQVRTNLYESGDIVRDYS